MDLKRPGSEKRSKTQQITIHDTIKISPESIPEGSRFKGYQDFVVQDIKIEGCNTLYRIERWKTPDGNTIKGKLPIDLSGSHFGPNLQTFILYQYYHALVTQPLLLEQLHEFGIDISSGHLSHIISEGKDCYHSEKDEILATGLEISDFIQADDTGARHDGQNGVCTFIGNDLFSYFESTDSKSRINFIELLRAGYRDYVINADALCWIHAERTFRKLIGYSDENIQALENTRSQIWELYAKLKEYKESPDDQKKVRIESWFDEIFTRQTCFASLNQALKRIYQNKSELLLVLDRPDIPIHNNLSERDIREYIKRRKVSGSTRSSPGRKCRDTFTSLKKTCRKLGVSFWEYIKDRVANFNAVPRLSDLMRAAT